MVVLPLMKLARHSSRRFAAALGRGTTKVQLRSTRGGTDSVRAVGVAICAPRTGSRQREDKTAMPWRHESEFMWHIVATRQLSTAGLAAAQSSRGILSFF